MDWVFDSEVYPNFFSVIFKQVGTNKVYKFLIFEETNDTAKLRIYLKSVKRLVGFNSENYDIPILGAVLSGLKNKDLYLFSKSIIEEELKPPKYYDYKKILSHIQSIDIKRILSFDSSLKQLGIVLKHPRIEELPLPPDTIITKDKIKRLLSYNLNDVIITEKGYLGVQGDIKLREFIQQKYGVDVMNSSNSGIANVSLERMYCSLTNCSPFELQNRKTLRPTLHLKNCLGKDIVFRHPNLIELEKNIKDTTLTEPYKKDSFKRKVTINKTSYSVGLGGFHSIDSPGIFKTENDTIIVDADVTSYYPNIAIINNFLPKHLDRVFLRGFSNLLEDRVKEKQKGNLFEAQSLKITILSTIGKYKYKGFWLYDPQAFFSVTLSGQLYLLMLVDMLEEKGIEIISANTDGITAKIKQSQLEIYHETCQHWQDITRFNLEFTTYKIYARRDVNSYIAQTDKGKIKTKGVFFDNTSEENDLSVVCNYGYNMPIVPKALKAFFIDKRPVEEFVTSSTDIFDFLISHKSDRKFQVFKELAGKKEPIQRTLRYYMPRKNGYKIVKISQENGSKISLSANHIVRLANDINPKTPFEEYDVDFDYYIKEVNKIIHQIQPPIKQLSLF